MNIKAVVILLCIALVSGCPRIAYLDVYNNTGKEIYIKSSDNTINIPPKTFGKIAFTYNTFAIASDLGNWIYERNIPSGGVDSKFFDGTLRVQVNVDGKVYVVQKGDKLPLSIADYEQPEGYPLSPNYVVSIHGVY